MTIIEGPKVCRLVYEYTPLIGGSITHIIETAENINPCLRKQLLIAPKFENSPEYVDRYSSYEIIRIPYNPFKWLQQIKNRHFKRLPLVPFVCFSYGYSSYQYIRRLSQRGEVDIIHSHGIPMGVVATIAGKLLKIPTIWMLHGTREAYSPISSYFETFVIKLFRPKYLLALDDGSPAITKFKSIVGDEGVTVVNHAIDNSKFYPCSPNKQLLESLGIDENNFIILSPHSLNSIKGVEYAIRAFEKFLAYSKNENTTLIIAGDGPQRQSLESMVQKKGIMQHIKFTGYIENSLMLNYFSISKIVLGTSTYSNVNRSIQEAMACGKPVVAFNSGGTDKVIRDGDTGLLVDSGNVDQMSECIFKLFSDTELRAAMGKSARDFILRNRSWENRVKTELSIYERAMKNI